MSIADAAGGRSAGGRRLAEADLPGVYSSRPGADPLKAQQFWAGAPAAPTEEPSIAARPAAAQPRAAITPDVPAPVDPAELLRRLAELAVAEASTEVRVEPDPASRAPLPRRSDARGGGALSGGVPPAPPRRDPAEPGATRRSLRASRPEQEPAPEEQSDAAVRASRVEMLADLMPKLHGLSDDRRPEMRALYALCFSMMASEGLAHADREVWRALLGLSKYDEDPQVRRIADAALTDLERHGTVPRSG
ncbi:hypothetical protein [Demequina mangrovi]|uniref:hypothetical protein n=1 Tax=Demequina mangrovi TaxID=1043493 RepID=UPI00115F9F62|nr:hypothetical protein [Demequina mangrovi]